MSILWCGGEDIDFPTYWLPYMTTTSGHFDSLYARGALNLQASYNVFHASKIFAGGAVSSFWLAATIYISSTANNSFIGLGKSGSLTGLFIGQASIGKARIQKVVDGTTMSTVATEPGTSWLNNWLVRFDLNVVSFGASATVKLYVNGATDPCINGTYDVTVTGMTTEVDRVVLYQAQAATAISGSEIIVADEDTRGMRLRTHYPDADGDSNQWSGGYGNVDELSAVDTDLANVNANDQIDLLNLVASPSGSFAVKAFNISARAMKSQDSTPTKLALGVKSGGSTDAGSDQSLTSNWDSYHRLMNVNPVTTNPWTTAELDAVQVQLKSRA